MILKLQSPNLGLRANDVHIKISHTILLSSRKYVRLNLHIFCSIVAIQDTFLKKMKYNQNLNGFKYP